MRCKRLSEICNYPPAQRYGRLSSAKIHKITNIFSMNIYLWGIKVGTLIAYKEKYNENSCFYGDYAMRAGVEELWIEKITSEISDRITRM